MSMVSRRVVLSALGLGVVASGASSASRMARASDVSAASGASSRSAYSFRFGAIDGGDLNLRDYQGQVLMVVNTASQCGFTNQYSGLQEIQQRYTEEGFSVIGVPSNNFGGQEPGSEEDIKAFCSGTYGVTFPLTGKTEVRGAKAHPFYRWAAQELGARNAPRWNFHKYLIDRNGQLLAAFPSHVPPTAPSITSQIEAALQVSAS